MTFRFKLRKGKHGATIIAEIRIGKGVRIRKSTPFILPTHSIRYWDENNQLLKVPNDIQNSKLIIKRLNEIRTDVYNEFSRILESKDLNITLLGETLDNIIFPEKIIQKLHQARSKHHLVVNYFQHYLDFFKENMSPFTGSPLSSSTLKSYENCISFVNRYIEHRDIKEFTFDHITKEFYYDFIQFGQEMGHTKNYIGSMIQKLKTIIQYGYDEGIHSNREFKKRYFKKFREEINHPYLTEDEIQLLINLDIVDDQLNTVRDIFVIACYTGLRIGDLMRFLKCPSVDMFNGREHIFITQHKTRKPIFIPLNKKVLAILDKRNGEFPPYLHQNTINKKIKMLLRRCGITQLYNIEKTVGGKLTTIVKPKYAMISCHSARRSFCTNAYNSGVPLQDIMAFSGHSSEKMVLLYIKASAKEKAKRASHHPSFD